MHLARRASPKLAHIGGVFAVIGLASLPGLLVTDFYDLALAQSLPRADSVRIADSAGDSVAAAILLASTLIPMLIGLLALSVATVRAGVARWWMPVLVVAGWLLPLVSGTGLVPAVAGIALIGVAFGSVGLKVARMSDQAWAERPARTTSAKAPKIAVASAA